MYKPTGMTITALVPVVKLVETSEKQTILHCQLEQEDFAYRIWPSTYLIERGTGKRAKLVTAFNISFSPDWTVNTGRVFTLIFEGLSKECTRFDLVEEIPLEGAFLVKDIQRNTMDVYSVVL